MPYIPETTEAGTVTEAKAAVIDRYQIHMIHIDTDPDNPMNTRVTVDWSKGFLDGSGKYVAVRRYNVMFKGLNLLTRFSAPTSGDTLYNEVQKAAWELLNQEGWLPGGEIIN